MKLAIFAAALTAACASVFLVSETTADACGCVHSPEPPDNGIAEFAINQSSEQIIFEVEEGFVTAHVLIRYAGKPDEFAWVVPIPSVPELSLSPETAFGFLQRDSSPQFSIGSKNECPVAEWTCEYADMPSCESPSSGCSGGCSADDDYDNDYPGFQDAGAGFAQDASSSTGDEPPVQVIERAVIGSYETIVFAAGDVDGTMQWLADEGFIVNSSMAPFIQSYTEANMLFLASKLVAGANTSDIKPLRMRFASDAPMIPLQLTAVAAEPEMTITAYIYGDEPFVPKDFDRAIVNPDHLSVDLQGRNNYPMLLSRSVDDAGGKSFVAEYVGAPIRIDFDQGTGCCNSDFDVCGIADDGICSCPESPFDAADCENGVSLVEGADLLNELADKHQVLTRLTTRMSATDMTYDPVFEPDPEASQFGRLTLANDVSTLGPCESDIIDTAGYDEIQELRDCASLYCGLGTCVATASGVGCDCEQGTTARRFIDIDGRPSTTCVLETAPVDFAEGGLELPDACATVDCGDGTCIDVGGFPTCQCNPGSAGLQSGLEAAPVCEPIVTRSTSRGAENFSAALGDVLICAPAPPSCGIYGWNVPAAIGNSKRGFECSYSNPSPEDTQQVASPSCADLGLDEPSSGCSTQGASSSLAGLGFGTLVFFLAFRRRRTSAVIQQGPGLH